MAHGFPTEGTKRLGLFLGVAAGGLCLGAYLVIMVLYGRPYWFGWYAVMAAILGVVFIGARLVVPLVEWVFAGYRDGGR